MAEGPADAPNAGSFFQRIEEGGANVPGPAARADRRVLWVNPDTGLRVDLHEWVRLAVDSGTPTVLSRMAAETTDLTIYVGGRWIEEIR